jgi:hypothetical protein
MMCKAMLTIVPLNIVLILPDCVRVKIPNTDFDEIYASCFERPRSRLHCTRFLLLTAQKYIV